MITSEKWLSSLSVLALATFGFVTFSAVGAPQEKEDSDEQEETISVEQLPDAVKAALMKAAHGARIREVEKETENGKTTYEVELVIETKLEVELAEDGKILEFEIEQGHDHDDEHEGDK